MEHFEFGKERRLLTSKDFNYLRGKACSAQSSYFRAYYRETAAKAGHTRMGLSVSKKVGNAVVRNRIKRQLREEFRLSPYRERGLDVLFVVSPRIGPILKGEQGQSLVRKKFHSLLHEVFKKSH